MSNDVSGIHYESFPVLAVRTYILSMMRPCGRDPVLALLGIKDNLDIIHDSKLNFIYLKIYCSCSVYLVLNEGKLGEKLKRLDRHIHPSSRSCVRTSMRMEKGSS